VPWAEPGSRFTLLVERLASAWLREATPNPVGSRWWCHVLQHVLPAVDTVRKQEHRALAAAGKSPLTRTKHAWLMNPATFSAKAWRACAALRESPLQTARALAMKESLRHLLDYTYVGAARTFVRR
jgi:hypothetical protein